MQILKLSRSFLAPYSVISCSIMLGLVMMLMSAGAQLLGLPPDRFGGIPPGFPNDGPVGDPMDGPPGPHFHHDGPHHDPHHWIYQDQNSWADSYPLCKGKTLRQSPIDIITSETIRNDMMSVEFVDYNQMIGIKTSNNGHSACINPIPPKPEAAPRLKLTGFPGLLNEYEYDLVEIHFHWGNENRFGSEHKLNGEQASAEMHMVHFRKGLQKAEIGNIENSVVVVGVFLEPSIFLHNPVVEEVVTDVSMANGTTVGEEIQANKPENLRNLVPLIDTFFYTYSGSLTTPPCYEVVTWIVIDRPVFISRQKLYELQNLETRDENGTHKIDVNFRNTQPLRNRPVFVSKSIRQVTTGVLKDHMKMTMPTPKKRSKMKSGKGRKRKLIG